MNYTNHGRRAKMKTTRLFNFPAVAVFLLFACVSQAASPVNVTSEGIAIKGYDTVAYFTQGKPIQGKKEFNHQWNNATWLFANEQHLGMFKKDPASYAPQYGGY
jgi:YHS domain-containing protein